MAMRKGLAEYSKPAQIIPLEQKRKRGRLLNKTDMLIKQPSEAYFLFSYFNRR
jgi:hypothetical protein